MNYEVSIKILPAVKIMSIRFKTTAKKAQIDAPKAFKKLFEYLQVKGAVLTGKAYNIYHDMEKVGKTAEIECCFEVAELVQDKGEIKGRILAEGEHAVILYKGSYEGVTKAWEYLSGWIDQMGFIKKSEAKERFLNRPQNPNEALTLLMWPVDVKGERRKNDSKGND